MKLLFASTNKGKLTEAREILSGFEILSLVDAGIIIEAAEDGLTFAENALKKAREYCAASGLPAIADDSGLSIDALGGEPGVNTALFLGRDTPQTEKNAEILRRMDGKNERTARFTCAAAMVYPCGRIIETEGTLEGVIAFEPKGSNGFGYDPIFEIPSCGKTIAELDSEKKNEISHRGKALRALAEILAAGGM
jgi:XTP/dITP diphosphohydrolase